MCECFVCKNIQCFRVGRWMSQIYSVIHLHLRRIVVTEAWPKDYTQISACELFSIRWLGITLDCTARICLKAWAVYCSDSRNSAEENGSVDLFLSPSFYNNITVLRKKNVISFYLYFVSEMKLEHKQKWQQWDIQYQLVNIKNHLQSSSSSNDWQARLSRQPESFVDDNNCEPEQE